MADIKINGATPSGFYYGGTAASAVYYGSIKVWEAAVNYNPLNLPAQTFRFQFSNTSYNPTSQSSNWKYSQVWTRVSSNPNVWDCYVPSYYGNTVYFYNSFSSASSGYAFNGYSGTIQLLGANTEDCTGMNSVFSGVTQLTSVALFDTTACTELKNLFDGCTGLTSVPAYPTQSCQYFNSMFNRCSSLVSVPQMNFGSALQLDSFAYNCTNLTTLPNFNIPNCTSINQIAYNCGNLQAVPTFTVGSVTNSKNAFMMCYKVESGALNLYNALNAQSAVPSNHAYTFYQCGKNTVTGAAELAQIPSSWGGTGA